MPAFYLFTQEQAEAITEATANEEWRIEPREIIAGPHVGKWAASPAIAHVPQLASFVELIPEGTTLVNTALAWPEEEE